MPQRFTSLWAGIHFDRLNVGEIYVWSRYMCLNPTLVPLCALPAVLMGCFASVFYLFHPYFICNKARRLCSLLDLIACLLQREKNHLRGEISCWVLTTYIGYTIFPLGTDSPSQFISSQLTCPLKYLAVTQWVWQGHTKGFLCSLLLVLPPLMSAAMKMRNIQKIMGRGGFLESVKGNRCSWVCRGREAVLAVESSSGASRTTWKL